MTIAEQAGSARLGGRLRPITAFLSYRRLDATELKRLERALHLRGVRSWRDVNDVPLGGATEDEILQGIASESDAFVLYATPSLYAPDSTFIWAKEIPAADRRWRDERHPVAVIYRHTTPQQLSSRCNEIGVTDFGVEANGEWVPSRDADQNSPTAVRDAHAVVARKLLRTLLARRGTASAVVALRSFDLPDLPAGALLDIDWSGILESADPTIWSDELFPALRDLATELEHAGVRELALYPHARLSLCVAFGAAIPLPSRIGVRLFGREGEWPQVPGDIHLSFDGRAIAGGAGSRALLGLGLSRRVDSAVASAEASLKPGHVLVAGPPAGRLEENVRPVAQAIGTELRALANLGVTDFHLLLAAPAPMAVAIGRQLHALGRVSLYYADVERQPVRAFTLNL